MPRPENPLDLSIGALARFAADLRLLRDRAGRPSYRSLSRSAHYSPTVLSEAAGGRKLPSLAVTLAYVGACGGDPADWQARWQSLADELRADQPGPDESAPYLGLAAFQPDDADRFFGREQLVADLTSRVRERRFVAVFGASGSGKSSLLRAGLVAAARTWGWPTLVCTPGARPSAALTELRPDPDSLLVVDQFEEVFTLCPDETERREFIAALLALAAPDGRMRVVLGVRADFYGHCGEHPALVAALRDAQVLVGAMTAEELRQAICGPAARAGGTVETGLMADLVAEATGQPGVLPLLSHALAETWRRRRGTRLTLAGYAETGGIQHAVARTAEQVYGRFDPAQRTAARHLLLRLVTVGEGIEDTKRRLPRRELDGLAGQAVVIEELAQARLITLDGDTVDLAHEAVIRGWPRLRDWLADDREGRRLHRQLTETADTWENLGEDPGTLYRGTRLARTADWATANTGALTPREQRFLSASETAELAEQHAVRRRNRRLRQLIAGLTVLLLVAAGAIGYAVRADQLAVQQRNLALARQALNAADSLRESNPALSAQLGLAAYQLAPNSQTRDNLLATFTDGYATLLTGHTSAVTALDFSPDGTLLATASLDHTVKLWRIGDLRALSTIPLPDGAKSVSFGSSGLAVAGGHTVTLWNITDPARPTLVSTMDTGVVNAVAVRGQLLAAADDDGTAQLWDLSNPAAPVRLATIPAGDTPLASAVFSPDGRTLGLTIDQVAQLWDIGNPRQPRRLGVLAGHRDLVSSVAFSPDGHTAATASWDHDVRIWDITDPAHPHGLSVLTGHTAIVYSVAFSPDGRTLASTGDGTRLWDVSDPAHGVSITTLTGGVYQATFSPDGTMLASDEDSAARLQDLRELPLAGHQALVSSVAFSPDGRVLATGSWDRTVRLWDVTDPDRPRLLGVPLTGQASMIRTVAFSPDGTLLLTASDDGTVWLWDVTNPGTPRHIGTARQPSGAVLAAAFSPDGRGLATGGSTTSALWDLTDPSTPVQLSTLDGYSGNVWSIAYGPGLVATGAVGDDPPRLWNVTDPRHPRQIGLPFGHLDDDSAGAFSPDGRMLAAPTAENDIRLIDLTNPDEPRQLGVITGHAAHIYAVAFSPDGHQLITGSADGTATLTDITNPASPRELGTFSQSAGIDTVAFAPDGHTVATGGNDRTARLWAIDINQVTTRICQVAHPRLTPDDWNRYFPGLPYQPPCGGS